MVTTRITRTTFVFVLALYSALLTSCGGDDEEPQSTPVVCMNCAGLSGTARLNCAQVNASRTGC